MGLLSSDDEDRDAEEELAEALRNRLDGEPFTGRQDALDALHTLGYGR